METGSAPGAQPATADSGPVWRFLITPRWLGWHVLMVAGCWGMLWLGDWQLHRALVGNGLSWAYTFEWPLFAGFAVVFWARTIRDEFRIRRGGGAVPEGAEEAGAAGLPAGLGTAAQVQAAAGDADDEELARYNRYLARLHEEVKGTRGKTRGFR